MRLLQLLAEEGPGFHALLAAGLIEQTEGRQTDGQVLFADGLGQLIHQFQDEAAALLRRAAILISPLVDVGAEELLREISIATVQLDTVEANFHRRRGRSAEVLDCLLDMRHGQLDGWMVRVPDRLRRAHRRVGIALLGSVPGRGRGRNSWVARHLRDGGTARVPQLAVDVPSLGVHRIHDLLPAFGLLLREDTGHTWHAITLVSVNKFLQSGKRPM